MPSSPRLILVRHGQCPDLETVLLGRTLDPALNETGRRQARALARRLHLARPALVETSPRLRTRETAAAIVGGAGGMLATSAALDELQFGRWAGRRFAALDADPQWRDWNEHRGSSRTPAGETIASVQARVFAHLRRRARELRARTIVLVTHVEVIRSVLLGVLRVSPDHYYLYPIEPGTFTTLRVDALGWRVECINERAPA